MTDTLRPAEMRLNIVKCPGCSGETVREAVDTHGMCTLCRLGWHWDGVTNR